MTTVRILFTEQIMSYNYDYISVAAKCNGTMIINVNGQREEFEISVEQPPTILVGQRGLLCSESDVASTHQKHDGPTKFVDLTVNYTISKNLVHEMKGGIVASFDDIVMYEVDGSTPCLTGKSKDLAKALGCNKSTNFVITFGAWSNHGCRQFVESLMTPRLWTLK